MAFRQIPPLPSDAPMVDGRGKITPDWQRFFVSLITSLKSVPDSYANDAAAAAGGVPIGGRYRNGSVLMVRAA